MQSVSIVVVIAIHFFSIVKGSDGYTRTLFSEMGVDSEFVGDPEDIHKDVVVSYRYLFIASISSSIIM